MEFISIVLYFIAIVSFIIVQAVSVNQVKSMFNKKLETFKGKIISEVGQKLLNENNKLNIQLTSVKDNLDLIRHQKSGFLNEKRKSIIELNSRAELWIRALIECSPASVKTPIDEYQARLIDKTTKAARLFYSARSTYRLYNENSEADDIIRSFSSKINKANGDRQRGIVLCFSKFSEYLSKSDQKNFESQTHLELDKKHTQKLHDEFMDLVKTEEEIFHDHHKELVNLKGKLLKVFSKEIKSSFLEKNETE